MNLSKYSNVLCNSREALHWARSKGLPQNTRIFTNSPALYFGEKNTYNLEESISLSDLELYRCLFKDLQFKIYDSLLEHKFLSQNEIFCTILAFLDTHKIFHQIIAISNTDFNDRLLYIKINGDNQIFNKMNYPIDNILKTNESIDILNYTPSSIPKINYTKSDINIFSRMYVGGLETIIYRLAIMLFKNIPHRFKNRQILISNENDLIIEVVSYLIRKGIAVRQIKPHSAGKESLFNEEKYHKIIELIMPLLVKELKLLINKKYLNGYFDIMKDFIKNDLIEFHSFRSRWGPVIAEEKGSRNVLLCNYPMKIRELSLIDICNDSKIPVVSTQHGVTQEICKDYQNHYSIIFENNASDVFLTFNKISSNNSQSSYFANGESYPIGLSKRYYRSPKSYKYFKSPQIIFLSTCLYKANLNFRLGVKSDIDISSDEIDLINNVLSKIPHLITYKTYVLENLRYIDQDPILDRIKSAKNIKIFNENIDAKYIMGNYRIIISSRATSTIGWALMTGKPLVFIDRKGDMELNSDAYKLFREGIFLFSKDSPGFNKDLISFLSKPISEIESLWNEKREPRQKLIDRYFSSDHKIAGELGSQIIYDKYFN